VSIYLHYWISKEPLSALDARSQWIKTVQDNSSSMMTDSASFHRLMDRLSILHYLVSGEIIPAHDKESLTSTSSSGDNSKKKTRSSAKKVTLKKVTPKVSRAPADYGSMVFWSVPPNCAPLESDIFFNAISMETLLDNFNEAQSIVDNLIDLRLHQLAERRQMIAEGIVSVELLCDSIEPANGHLIQKITALKPETASCSNLVDYSDHGFKSFIQVAKQLSVNRHFGQSMNWVCMVYVACLTDYIARNDLKGSMTSLQKHSSQSLTSFLPSLSLTRHSIWQATSLRRSSNDIGLLTSRSMECELSQIRSLQNIHCTETQGHCFSSGSTKSNGFRCGWQPKDVFQMTNLHTLRFGRISNTPL
jgi:hypothetical protein